MGSLDSSGGTMDSSGGCGDDDEEFTSCLAAADAGSIALSSFLMNGYTPAHQLQLLHRRDDTQRSVPPPPLPAFDALPNFFDQLPRPGLLPHRNHQQLFQLGCGVGSDELGVLLPPSAPSSSANLTGVLQLPAHLGYCPSPRQIRAGLNGEATNPPLDPATDPPPKPVEGCPAGTNNDNNGVPPRRNPKKRTRASRRAPTTVLTTDTSNFRMMVQEFTGIPAPPFDTGSSLFQRGRFNLFGTTFPGIAAGAGPSIPSSPPSYLLRPLTHKPSQSPPPPPTLLSIPSAHNMASTTTELLFPLLSDNNGNGPRNASLSLLLWERGQEQSCHGPLGVTDNAVIEELVRLGRQDGGSGGITDTPHSGQNDVGGMNRSEGGTPIESWICSSD